MAAKGEEGQRGWPGNWQTSAETTERHDKETMYDEDVIAVSITASKESAADQKYTMYTAFVRNLASGSKVIVRRRYSDFFKLRKDLIDFVSWGHCKACDDYQQLISGYHFPRRRLLRSSQPGVVKERMDSLALFLRHVLRHIYFKTFDDCEHARLNVENRVLKEFMEIEYEDLFPRTTARAHILQALEEKRQLQQVKAAGLRAKSAAYAMQRPEAPQETTRPIVVDADTCHRCLQKWTHCYCNEEDDRIDMQRYRRPSTASDSSQCSRCDREWDQCYCCQQNSPTTSSVCSLSSRGRKVPVL
ncbi:hypothetical protein Poli38472_008762 [Pythium oligandrum]|uniref:PX domain-containing protein n=1 Tax=Pythium oligandrum TaxID=41045 RepID=A0A8K1FCR8_PYTOL|nr:hypothetical protein Poli38472_008762 [Pythium oligandrum]|eukprot:TMW56114.1 hypothetical protein Poli38472_008762 [Pythium oligandrum]